MDIEEIRSNAPDMGFVNLGKPLYELCDLSYGRIPYVIASFKEEAPENNILYDMFGGECYVRSYDRPARTIAIGFVDDVATVVFKSDRQMHIRSFFYMTDVYAWRAAIFANLFQFGEDEITGDTCVYDEANDLLWDITFRDRSDIEIEIYHTYEYD